jgi:hypothetical protein
MATRRLGTATGDYDARLLDLNTAIWAVAQQAGTIVEKSTEAAERGDHFAMKGIGQLVDAARNILQAEYDAIVDEIDYAEYYDVDGVTIENLETINDQLYTTIGQL